MNIPQACPECWKENSSTRDTCWNCGYLFTSKLPQTQQVTAQYDDVISDSWRNWREQPFPFLLAGLFVLFFFARPWNFTQARRSLDWPTTGGKIVVSEVREHSYTDEFYEYIAYDYQVDSRSYTSASVSFGDGLLPYSTRQNLRQVYQVGKTVTVYYDPANPRSAVLVPGNGYGPLQYLLTAVGVVLTAGSLFLVFAHLIAKSYSRFRH